MNSVELGSAEKLDVSAIGGAPIMPYGKPICPPSVLTQQERAELLQRAGLEPGTKLATLIVGMRLQVDDEFRKANLLFLLDWIDHFYGDLFDVLLIEQDEVSRVDLIADQLRPYVRHEFIYNPEPYNRGWGYNAAVKHFTTSEVVALMDTDVLTGANFCDEIVACHTTYKAISPYSNVYFTDPSEAQFVTSSYTFAELKREEQITKPVTITGGVVIMRRDVYQSVMGFEQYTYYGGEDRAFDVTLLNHCDPSELRTAPSIYVHLYHPNGKFVRGNLDGILSHLDEFYGCRIDRTLNANQFIHKNCDHVDPKVTKKNSAERLPNYGNLDLYKSERPLAVNGVFEQPVIESTAEPIFPPDLKGLDHYEANEFYKAPDPDVDKISDLHNAFEGKRCFIIGNGPSLNNHDLSLLKGEYVFAVNSFFYKTDQTDFRPTFFVVEDSSVMKENIDRIRDFEAPYKFFPTIYKSLHPADDNVHFFKMNRGFYEKSSPNYCVPRFSTDASKVLYCGQSVTYINLQLAFFMGFTEVHLIGMDFDYVIPKEHKRNGDLILSTTDDPNHFHKDYFGKGKTWKDPKLERVAQNYHQAKLSFESVGRRIYNATVGGKLEIFDRVEYTSLFDGNPIVTLAQSTTAAAPTDARDTARKPFLELLRRATKALSFPPSETHTEHKPFYASFGAWLKPRFPLLFNLLRGTRRVVVRTYSNVRYLYGIFALWLADQSPTSFRLIQASLWVLRAAVRKPLVPFVLIIGIAALGTASFDPAFSAEKAWMLVGLYVLVFCLLMSVTGTIFREAMRRFFQGQQNSISIAIRQSESLAKKHNAILIAKNAKFQAKIAENEKRIAALNVASEADSKRFTDQIGSLNEASLEASAETVENSKYLRKLDLRLSESVDQSEVFQQNLDSLREYSRTISDSIGQAVIQAISQISSSQKYALDEKDVYERAQTKITETISAIESGFDKSFTDLGRNISKSEKDLTQAYTELSEELAAYQSNSDKSRSDMGLQISRLNTDLEQQGLQQFSLDMLSVLRVLHRGNPEIDALQSLQEEVESEHGHRLLMVALAELDRKSPGSLKGKTVIEIGTTRERRPNQSSTEKLAILTSILGMNFVTVDMDELNSKRARSSLRPLNPNASAVTQKGEDFLALYDDPIDFIYLDAFDFNHDDHSDARRARYKKILESDIEDEACWLMHLHCAHALVPKVADGGLVVLDDTWTDSDGELAGKGKLAVPYLLANGFETVTSTKMTICLRKK